MRPTKEEVERARLEAQEDLGRASTAVVETSKRAIRALLAAAEPVEPPADLAEACDALTSDDALDFERQRMRPRGGHDIADLRDLLRRHTRAVLAYLAGLGAVEVREALPGRTHVMNALLRGILDSGADLAAGNVLDLCASKLAPILAAKDASAREATAEHGEAGKLLGAVICYGTLRPGEAPVDPPQHAAVAAILGVVAERDRLRARVAELEARLKPPCLRCQARGWVNQYGDDVYANMNGRQPGDPSCDLCVGSRR